MQDGAKQEIEEGKFVIYTGQKTAQMDLGFIVGLSNTKVKVKEIWEWRDRPMNKTPERVIIVGDDIAESMDKEFFDEMRHGIMREEE